MILTAYLDESGTHKGCPITLMGGYVGTAENWSRFDHDWGRLLAFCELPYIHAKDLKQGSGPFADKKKWSLRRRAALGEFVEDLARKYALFGLAVFLRDDDHEQVFGTGRRTRKIQLDTKYGFCFRGCLAYILQTLKEQRLNDDLELHLILEQGHVNAGDAQRIYDHIFMKYAPPEQKTAVKTIAFREKVETPGLQAADHVAYPALLRELSQRAEVHATPTDEMQIPIDGPDCPVFRVAVSIGQLKELKSNILEVEDAWKAWGEQRAAEISSRRS